MSKKLRFLCCFWMVFLFSFISVCAQADNDISPKYFLYLPETEQNDGYSVQYPGTEESYPKPAYSAGDMTGDGKINAMDLIRLKRYLGGEDVTLAASGDVTGDGKINAMDLIRLKRYLGGENVKIYGGTEETDPKCFTYETIDASSCRITGYTCTDKEITIPSKNSEGLAVTEIGEMAFFSNRNITKVTIPSSVKSIGGEAFEHCKSLAEINLPEGLERIDHNAFSGTELTKVHLPDSITALGEQLFGSSDSSPIVETNYPKNLQTIIPYEYNGNYNYYSPFVHVESITIPEGVTTVPAYAFKGSDAPSIQLPSTLETIEDYAFSGALEITEIEIPSGVVSIGDEAFSWTNKLSNVSFAGYSSQASKLPDNSLAEPSSLTRIGAGAFSFTNSLDSIDLPDSVTFIGENAFRTSVLSQIHLPENLKALKKGTFINCFNLTELHLPDGLEILEYGFISPNGYVGTNQQIYNGPTYLNYPKNLREIVLGNGNLSPYSNFKALESIVVPEGVTSLPDYVFRQNYFKSIYLPSSLTNIGTGVLDISHNLERIYCPRNGYAWNWAVANRLEDKLVDWHEGTPDLKYFTFTPLDEPGTCRISEYTGPAIYINSTTPGVLANGKLNIPSAGPDGCIVTEIGHMGGMVEVECPNNSPTGSCRIALFVGVSIPSTVKAIREKAFFDTPVDQEGQDELIIPEGVEIIEAYAFDWVYSQKIVLPDSLITIGSGAFANAPYTSEINYPVNLQNLIPGSDDVYGTTSPFPSSSCSYWCEEGENNSCNDFKSMVIPEGVTFIPDRMFYYSALETVTLPDTLNSIGEDAFSNSKLKGSLVLPPNLKTIGENAFRDCRDLTDVYVPASVIIEDNFPFTAGHGDSLILHAVVDSPFWNWVTERYPDWVENGIMVPWDGVNSNKVTVSGVVTTDNVTPIENIRVIIVNTKIKNDVHSTLTDYRGQWSMLLPKDTSYDLTYSSDDYIVTGATTSFTTSEDLSFTATAISNGTINPDITFTMSQNGELIGTNSILVGSEVEFVVSTPAEADMVRLVVDNVNYDIYTVSNDPIIRVFHSVGSGSRIVQFQIHVNGEWTDYSAPQILNLTTLTQDGFLTAPVIEPIGNIEFGQELTIHWTGDPHANHYAIYLSDSYSYSKVDDVYDMNNLSYTFEGAYFNKESVYSVEVIATGYGWSQASGTADFHVVSFPKDFTLVRDFDPSKGFVTNDMMWLTVNNPSRRFIRLHFTCAGKECDWKDHYVPSLDAPANSDVKPTLTFVPEKKGSYTVSVMAFLTAASKTPLVEETSSKIRFLVENGDLDSIQVGNGSLNQNASNPIMVLAKGKHNIQKIDVYLDTETNYLTTMTAEDSNPEDINSRLSFIKVVEKGKIREGYHKLIFIAEDSGGKRIPTESDSIYFYTGNELDEIYYPKNNKVHVREFPFDDENSGNLLSIAQELTVLGTWSNTLYYVQTNLEGKTVEGYVGKNQVSPTMVEDLSNFPMGRLLIVPIDEFLLFNTENPYNITLIWIGPEVKLPANAAYNAYWVAHDGQKYKLNKDLLKTPEVTFSSAIIGEILSDYPEYDGSVDVYLRVELVDTAIEEVVNYLEETDVDYIYNLGQADTSLQEKSVRLSVENLISVHDLLSKGSYTYNGRVYEGPDWQSLKLEAKIYSYIKGEFGGAGLGKNTRAALMANLIMNQISDTKVIEPMPYTEIQRLLDLIGFIPEVSEKMALYYKRIDVTKLDLVNNFNDRKIFQKSFTWNLSEEELGQMGNIFDCVTTITDLIDVAGKIFYDYFKFRSVTRDDVQVYIDYFDNSGSEDLEICSSYLKIMTYNDDALAAYIAKSYGAKLVEKKLKDALLDFGGDLLILGGLPPHFMLAAKGAQIANNILFGTDEVLAAAYELEALTSMSEVARNQLNEYADSLLKDHTKENYRRLINLEKVYEGLIRAELMKFNEFCVAANSGLFAKLQNALYNKDVPEVNVDTIISTFNFSFTIALNAYNDQVIGDK